MVRAKQQDREAYRRQLMIEIEAVEQALAKAHFRLEAARLKAALYFLKNKLEKL